jgi:hypothetical protein
MNYVTQDMISDLNSGRTEYIDIGKKVLEESLEEAPYVMIKG